MKKTNRWIAVGWALLGATMTVGAAAMMTVARAQVGGPDPQPGGPRPEQPIIRPGFGGGQATVTATDRYVYVLRGNRLYQFDVNGLRLIAQTEVPFEPMGMRPGAEGREGNRLREGGDRPSGNQREGGDRPRTERREGGDRPQGDRERPRGDRPAGERPAGERPRGDIEGPRTP